jgi:hypothetical protein
MHHLSHDQNNGAPAKERARFLADFAVTIKEPQWRCVFKVHASLKHRFVLLDLPGSFEKNTTQTTSDYRLSEISVTEIPDRIFSDILQHLGLPGTGNETAAAKRIGLAAVTKDYFRSACTVPRLFYSDGCSFCTSLAWVVALAASFALSPQSH